MSGSTPATAPGVIAFLPTAGTVGFPSFGSVTVALTPVPPGATITYQGITLTSVAGARTPGSNDFDGSLGSTAAIAADILAAILDAANSWSAVVTASIAGSVVSLTTIAVGYNTFGSLISSDASVTITGMAGGEVLLESFVADAARMVNADCYGDKTCTQTINATLHFLASTIGGIPGADGPVSSVKVGDISQAYAQTALSPDAGLWGSTMWGRNYLILCETVFCNGTTGASLAIGMVC